MEYTVSGLSDYLFRTQNLSAVLKERFPKEEELISHLEKSAVSKYVATNYFSALKGYIVPTRLLFLEGDIEYVLFIYLDDGKHSYLFWDKEYYSKRQECEKEISYLLRYSPLFMHLSRTLIK